MDVDKLFEIIEETNERLVETNAKLDLLLEYAARQEFINEKAHERVIPFQKTEYKESIAEISIDDIEKYKLCLLLGYPEKDVHILLPEYIRKLPSDRHIRIIRISEITSIGDVPAVLTNLNQNDLILVDIDKVVTDSRNLHIVIEAVYSGALNVKRGQGASAKSILVDLPKFNCIFYATSELYISNRIKSYIECCYSNEQ